MPAELLTLILIPGAMIRHVLFLQGLTVTMLTTSVMRHHMNPATRSVAGINRCGMQRVSKQANIVVVA
jgi:hypothetical protein